MRTGSGLTCIARDLEKNRDRALLLVTPMDLTKCDLDPLSAALTNLRFD